MKKSNFYITLQTTLEIFTEYLDSIYYEGFTESLANEDPERYSAELEMFKESYC